MANPNTSSFLGNHVPWMLAKHLTNSDFYSIYHNATVTVNLFDMLELLSGMCLTCAIKCFPSFGMTNLNPSTFKGNVQ